MMAKEPATAQPGCGIGGRGGGEGPAMGRGGGIDCRDVAKEEAEVAKDSRWADWAEEAVSVIRRNRRMRGTCDGNNVEQDEAATVEDSRSEAAS